MPLPDPSSYTRRAGGSCRARGVGGPCLRENRRYQQKTFRIQRRQQSRSKFCWAGRSVSRARGLYQASRFIEPLTAI